jgi:hypothetical protein
VMTDPASGAREPVRERLARLGAPALDGAARQRAVAAERGPRGLVDWLAAEFASAPHAGSARS